MHKISDLSFVCLYVLFLTVLSLGTCLRVPSEADPKTRTLAEAILGGSEGNTSGSQEYVIKVTTTWMLVAYPRWGDSGSLHKVCVSE